MAKQYWLVKSEPEVYSFENLVKDKQPHWDGVCCFQASNNLRAMKVGDPVLVYHSQTDKAVVGIAEVVREHYPDPKDETGNFSVVELAAKKALKTPVTLATIKSTPELATIALIRQSRLSVMGVTKSEYDAILKLGA